MKQINIGDFVIGDNVKFILIAGPCVLEDEAEAIDTARYLQKLTAKLKIPFIFKASYDKANRTSIKSYRGPGSKKGLAILKNIKEALELCIEYRTERGEEIPDESKSRQVLIAL